METDKKPKIFIILGPTCSGKTSLAVDLCKRVGGVIISADSRQVYKDMNIGTGKVPTNDKNAFLEKVGEGVRRLDGIEIYGYDLVFPGERFSTGDFREYAQRVVKEELAKDYSRNIFVVGGTGFYIDVLTGVSPIHFTETHPRIREELSLLDSPTLLSKLKSLNLGKYERVDKNNRRRIQRAVELELAGNSLSSPLPLLPYEFVYFGLHASREVLYRRADAWVDFVWEHGLVQETKTLLAKYGNCPQVNGLVYKTVLSYLNEACTKPEAVQRCKFDIHAYIRRQQTWFKRNKNICWFDITKNPLNNVEFLVKST